MIDATTSLERLAVALLVGFLIGLDRERAEARKEQSLFAGVRTFPLIAVTGAVPMLVEGSVGPALLVASFLAVAGVICISYYRSSVDGRVGATTEISAIATFLIGVLAGAGQLTVAGAAGVAVSVLLVAKVRLEAFSIALTTEEIQATLELAVVTVIVLPLLPNRQFGPGGVLNPREIWVVVVLVSALSFVGFIAVRLLGERRGMALTGALGGLVSSTAVTLALAQRSREGTNVARTGASAAVLASAIMAVRIAVLAGAVDIGILRRLLPVVGAMAASGAVAAWWIGRGVPRVGAPGVPVLSNPFRLRAALTFGAIYAAVLLMVHGAGYYFGQSGLYATSALSGAADVDAPTIAFARMGPGPSGWAAATAAITIAAATNNVVKAGLALALGAGPFRVQVPAALVLMTLLGIGTCVLMFV